MPTRLSPLVIAAVLLVPVAAFAARHRVPADHATIQLAVDAAQPGEEVLVSSGQWCGATITKQVELVGKPGATIIGCPAPALNGVLRIGFMLQGSAASGTAIRGFRFDGNGVSNSNLAPLSFAIFSRQVNQVKVTDNRIEGTVQAITNTGGSYWNVVGNRIIDLTAFPCTGQCGGGTAIAVQQRNLALPRAVGNLVAFNAISGTLPDNITEFSMAGVNLMGQDGAAVFANQLTFPRNKTGTAQGIGIEVANTCCGEVTAASATDINAVIVFNDGKKSEVALRVEPDENGGAGNSQGAVIEHNLGVIDIFAP
jgi:hypothetical protein